LTKVSVWFFRKSPFFSRFGPQKKERKRRRGEREKGEGRKKEEGFLPGGHVFDRDLASGSMFWATNASAQLFSILGSVLYVFSLYKISKQSKEKQSKIRKLGGTSF